MDKAQLQLSSFKFPPYPWVKNPIARLHTRDKLYVYKSHALISETITWNWLEIHEKEFEDTKTAITNVMTLTTFDMNKDTAVIMDRSCKGLGFLLYQTSMEDEKKSVIQIGSTGLKPRETLCSPVELESMAIRYMIKETDHYLRACPNFKI